MEAAHVVRVDFGSQLHRLDDMLIEAMEGNMPGVMAHLLGLRVEILTSQALLEEALVRDAEPEPKPKPKAVKAKAKAKVRGTSEEYGATSCPTCGARSGERCQVMSRPINGYPSGRFLGDGNPWHATRKRKAMGQEYVASPWVRGEVEKPPDYILDTLLQQEAEASIRLDGETQSLEEPTEVMM